MSWSDAVVAAVVGAIVGGILTVVGGFLGVLWVRKRDEADADKRFVAAVTIVLDELGVNEINIKHLVGQSVGQLEVYDSAYRSVELILANRLPTDDRRLVAEAYAPLRSRWAGEVRASSMDWVALKAAEVIQPNKEALGAALKKIEAARLALPKYIRPGQY